MFSYADDLKIITIRKTKKHGKELLENVLDEAKNLYEKFNFPINNNKSGTFRILKRH